MASIKLSAFRKIVSTPELYITMSTPQLPHLPQEKYRSLAGQVTLQQKNAECMIKNNSFAYLGQCYKPNKFDYIFAKKVTSFPESWPATPGP